jgi:hypothetical protein
MAVSEAGGLNRLKAAAPMGAAALAVVAAIIGGSLLTDKSSPLPPEAPIVSGAPSAPASAPQPGSAIPGIAFDQVPGAGAGQASMEIVVKFKDDAKVKDIIDTFWRDQPSARAKFQAFKASRPEFANLKLDRVTYSNELVLVNDGGAAPAERLAAMRATAAKLKSVGDISYAEPNLTALPGGQ